MKKEWDEKQERKQKIAPIFMSTGIVIILLLVVFCMFYFHSSIMKEGLKDSIKYNQYDKHYVLITGNNADPLWDSIYEGALEQAVEENAYVEYLGKNLSVDYSINELLQIAIDAKADGIIVEGNESEETTALIDKAVTSGIVVTTVFYDSSQSKRQSFVGVNSYNLGQEYGEQLLELCDESTERIFVLMDTNATDSSQNIVYLGIKEAVEKIKDNQIAIQAVAVDNENAFSAEESIRDIIMDTQNIPDIMICLNAVNTQCAYQAVVDYNKVGEIKIIGNYDSDTILGAIEKKIIYSTISIDARQMGNLSIQAMEEYMDTGHVSGYLPVNTKIINEDNVNLYRNAKQEMIEND